MYHKPDLNYPFHLPTRKSNTAYTSSSRCQAESNLERIKGSAGLDYTSSYLIKKGPQKIKEPSKDYNFEEYFRILPPHLYTRYYDSHKFLNHGRRFFPNLKLNLNRNIFGKSSSTSSSIVSTPSSVQCSRSPSPVPISSPPTSPQLNYDFTNELVDGIHLSRAKSPCLSRPLSPISSQLSTSSASSKNLLVPLANKPCRNSSHPVTLPSAQLDDEEKLDDNELQIVSTNEALSESQKEVPKAVSKTEGNYAMGENKKENNERSLSIENLNGSRNQLNSNDFSSNLIKMLSQNIIELTQNLNLLLNDCSNEHSKSSANLSQIKSTEPLKDSDLVNKIDQLRKVSEKLQDCVAQQNLSGKIVSNETQVSDFGPVNHQSNTVEQLGLITDLQAKKVEPGLDKCESTLEDEGRTGLDQGLIVQQQNLQPTTDQKLLGCDQGVEKNQELFDKQNQYQKLEISISENKANRLQENEKKDDSQDDEFFECIIEEQKGLRKTSFKSSRLNLGQLIDKAIDEQLLGQWLELGDSLDNEESPIKQKSSIEEVKHKFATKLAIIHYKLYQKYSKTKSISLKKWQNRKLNKCNKIQSKYTLLQGLMDDNQFIQFLMDKISYFMRKIRLSKSQRKELKKSMSKLDLEIKKLDDKQREQKLERQAEFDKDSLRNEELLDQCKEMVIKERMVLDENDNKMSTDRLNEQANSPSIEGKLDKLNEIEQKQQDTFFKKLNEKKIEDLNERDLLVDPLDEENVLDEFNDKKSATKKGFFLSKHALLFLFTFIIFIILIVLFRSLSFDKEKKSTNFARSQPSSSQPVLQPASLRLQQQTTEYLPACDHKILLEAQKFLGVKLT